MEELEFLHSGRLLILSNVLLTLLELQKSQRAYEEQQRSRCSIEKEMLALIWDVDELKQLNDEGRNLRMEVSAGHKNCEGDGHHWDGFCR